MIYWAASLSSSHMPCWTLVQVSNKHLYSKYIFSHTKYRNNTKLLSFLRVIPLHSENRRGSKKELLCRGGRQEGRKCELHTPLDKFPFRKKGRKLELTEKSMFSISAQAGGKKPRKSWPEIMLPPPVPAGPGTGERDIAHPFISTLKSQTTVTVWWSPLPVSPWVSLE